MFGNVVVGVDEYEGGRDAIALAKLFAGGGAQVTLVHVAPTDPRALRRFSPAYDPTEQHRVHDVLRRISHEAGITAEIRSFAATSVGRGLHVYAQRHAANLLVIGSSRRSLFGRVLVGDDTRESLNGAPCAVAIAPAGYHREEARVGEIGVAYNGSPESEHALRVATTLAKATRASCPRSKRYRPLPTCIPVRRPPPTGTRSNGPSSERKRGSDRSARSRATRRMATRSSS